MTWLWVVYMTSAAGLAAFIVSDLSRMRREAQRMASEIAGKEAEADRYLAEAAKIHAQAVRRGLRVVGTEPRIH